MNYCILVYFISTDKTIEVKVPFSQLIPTKFARSVSVPKGFDSSKVYAFQFTLSKFEYDGGLNPKFSEVLKFTLHL
jgi:hypothetical protein